jgi:PAS domain S-box-containing protein
MVRPALPYDLKGPVNAEDEAIYLNAIPLLVLGAAYVLAGAALLPSVWRERRRIREVELSLALVFPCGGAAALIFGAVVLVEREPIGNGWVALGAIVLAAVPLAFVLARWRDRALLLTSPQVAREAELATTEGKRTREQQNAFTIALARTDDVATIGRLLAETVAAVVDAEFAALALIEEKEARGVYALFEGEEQRWWRDVRLDLHEPSAIASAAFEAAPFAVFDVESSPYVNRAIAEQVGAKSGVWVPLVSAERVTGVLAVATTRERRAFTPTEVSVLQELSAEAALAVDRVSSGVALSDALQRERLLARISQRVRLELDLDAVLEAAVTETAAALGASRCFIRLGEPGEEMPVAGEWAAPGLEPVGERAPRLPVSNLAARELETVAVADVATAPELADASLGRRETDLELGSRAVLATPVVVFDAVIGVLAVHRPEPGAWSRDEVALAEAVAHEAGLALHTARLLDENDRRLRQQSALLKSAQAVTGELRLSTVLQRLVDEVTALVGGEAADCYLLDPQRGVLRCAAVKGLPKGLVGYEFEAAKGVAGEAIARGRAVVSSDYEAVGDPVPHEAYAGFGSAIVAPIAWGDEVRGVLGVGARAAGAFSDSDRDALEALAGLASVALRNAAAFEEGTRQTRIQRGFYRIAAVLGQPLSLSATLDAVAQAANEALGGASAAVFMPRSGAFELAGSHGLAPELSDALASGLPASETALLGAVQEGRVLASPTLRDDDRFGPEWRRVCVRGGCGALLAIPLQAEPDQGGEAGIVIIFFDEERRFEDDDLELATHLAGAARAALERSALYEEERTARSLAQQLARTGALLATELEPAAVLEEVVRQAPALVGVEAAAIRILEGAELVISAVESEADPDVVLGARSPATGRLSGDVLQSRAPVAIEDASVDDRLAEADPLVGDGYRGYLGVPLIAPEGAVHGVLSVYSRGPKTWRTDEIEALSALAANMSSALSNAELYQRVAVEKERSFAILANIADGIVAVDRDGRVLLWNKAAEEITGVPAAEAVGRSPFQVLGRNLESERDASAGDRLVSILRGGEEVWLSLTEAVMRDPAGAVAGRIFAFRDISAERLVEQMKSEFVSTVSQELRRPLTSIYGFAETLMRPDIPFREEERRTFLGYIVSESERLTTIVDALLNVARLDAGDLQMNLVPTDVGSLVSEVVSTLQHADVDVNGHRFVVDVPTEPVAAEADPEKLREVLRNLIDNAVKFSPGGTTVTVAARRLSETVEVSVADQGIGIPAAERDRIFRKFYRGDASAAAARVGGTGLGLFIAQGLVAAMGGRIWVDSREGEGSSFTFELPLAAAASESAPRRVRASERL